MTKAIYAFSGDPITYGHINIAERSAKIFDHVIVAIGENEKKKYTFSLEEREEMARRTLSHIRNIKVTSFKGLLVEYAYEQDASVIVRGIRNNNDFDYENMSHQVGKTQELGGDACFFVAGPGLSYVSSSAVKALYYHHGDIHKFVPLYVKHMMENKISHQTLIGVTGSIASGKSTFCQMAIESGAFGKIHNIDLDEIVHEILYDRPEPAYRELREEIGKKFGEGIVNIDMSRSIDRKKLGDIVFSVKEKMAELNELLRKPILVRFRKEIEGKIGIILVNAALLAEANELYLCNNNVILTHANPTIQRKRLKERGLNASQIGTRVGSQYSSEGKQKSILSEIGRAGYGRFEFYDSSDSNHNMTHVTSILTNMLDKL